MIEVKNLVFGYKNNKKALNNISFTVEQGEIFGFLGPNGSGKSTTQKILTGILKNYHGSVKICGQEVKNTNYQFYNDIGVLFEFPYLYTSLSAEDNLKYFSSFYPVEKRQATASLLKKVQLKPDFWKKPVSAYSKGMKQRTSMARALISSPAILFLDEPTSGLDPAGAVLFRQLVREEQARGTTIFLTTHNMYDADLLCDRIAFITDGEIRVTGTSHQLKSENAEQKVAIEYVYQGKTDIQQINSNDIARGLPFTYDRILSIHSIEPTLEDIFIGYTGKGLNV